MERATIITLGNATPMTATSFEEAFGEYSNLFGPKARARRQKRRMERINNRKERRKARQEGRLDKKRRRVEARAERRQMRSSARQRRRDERSEGKRRRERADLEQERELNPEQEEEQQGGDDGGYAPQGGYDDAPQGGGYDEPQGGYDEGGSDDGGYAQEEGGYEEESEEFDGDYDDFDGDDIDDFDGDYDDFDGDDTDDFDGDDLESDGFDGELYDFDGNSEMIDAKTSPQVNQNIMDAAKRIEWNLEMASRLKDKGNSPKVAEAVSQCQNRVAELESSMDGYCNFEGDFTSDADGKLKYMMRKGMNKLPMQEKRKRWQELLAARLKARKERNAIRMKNGLKPVATPVATPTTAVSVGTPAAVVSTTATATAVPMKAQLMQLRNQYRKRISILKMRVAALRTQYLTDAAKNKPQPEQLALKQQFELKRNAIKSRMEALKKQYLERVNAIKMSKGVSSATGIIGLDDAGDYDATGYEIKLGADGTKTSKIPFKAIAIGLVIGGLGVFLLKKYKVI